MAWLHPGPLGGHISALGRPSASLLSPLPEPRRSRQYMAVVKCPSLPAQLGWVKTGWMKEVWETKQNRISKKNLKCVARGKEGGRKG